MAQVVMTLVGALRHVRMVPKMSDFENRNEHISSSDEFEMAQGAFVIRNCATEHAPLLLTLVDSIVQLAPLRPVVTPGGTVERSAGCRIVRGIDTRKLIQQQANHGHQCQVNSLTSQLALQAKPAIRGFRLTFV
jgi:hypothetical protein